MLFFLPFRFIGAGIDLQFRAGPVLIVFLHPAGGFPVIDDVVVNVVIVNDIIVIDDVIVINKSIKY